MLRGREAPALMEGAGGDGAQLGAQLVRREPGGWPRPGLAELADT